MANTTKVQEFFAANSPFGVIAGWKEQTGGGVTKTKERASALDSKGNEFRHVDHSEQHSVSCTYIPDGTATDRLAIPAAGALLGGYVVDSVTVSYSQEFPTMAIKGHKHALVVEGAYENMRSYSATVELPYVPIGVPDQIGPLSCDGARSATYELKCNHVDEVGGTGYLIGADNYDGTEQISIESACPITINDEAGEWTDTSNSQDKTNTGATTNTVTVIRHLAHDTI